MSSYVLSLEWLMVFQALLKDLNMVAKERDAPGVAVVAEEALASFKEKFTALTQTMADYGVQPYQFRL